MSSFFITGTDTNVGKTIVTRAIMQALQKAGIQVVGYKPIAFGQDEPIYSLKSLQEESDYETKDNSDVLTLMNSTRENVTYEEVNSYTFLHTIPILTAEYRFSTAIRKIFFGCCRRGFRLVDAH